MDILSDTLKSIRFEGAVFFDAHLTAPWCMHGSHGMSSVMKRLAGAEQVVLFHFVTQGSCLVRLAEGGEILEARAGDLLLFPHDDRCLMGSDLHLAPLAADWLLDDGTGASTGSDGMPMRHGGGGVATHVVCGYLACSRGLCRALFEALPRVMRIPIGDGHSATLLRELLRAGVRESSNAKSGAQSTLAKLAELMFVEALRRHVQLLPPERTGWLAAVRDVPIGRALGLLHDEPGRAWTVDTLAREVALSRSLFAQRFTVLVGESPMQYLTRWRLALAARALRAGDEAITRLAERSGYATDAAFSRAFKREFGLPPSAWRAAPGIVNRPA